VTCAAFLAPTGQRPGLEPYRAGVSDSSAQPNRSSFNHTRPTAERLLVIDCLSALIQRGRGADQSLPRAESLRSWGPALRVVLGAGSRGLTPALPGRQSGRNAKTLPSRIMMLSTATHLTPHQQKKLAPR
jgi:hypothetical protein